MASCCEPDRDGYHDMFTTRRANRAAARFRSHGLDRDSARIADMIEGLGLEGASVLEIGGGVGQLHLDLLRRGASRATSIELVDSYDAEAEALARERGLTDRVTRLHGDIAADPDAAARHDIVVMHRVVCCYPDAERLLSVAADHAGRVLVFSHPPRNLVSKAITGLENLGRRARRRSFRVFVHDPQAMAKAASDDGRLQERVVRRGAAWHIVGLTAEPTLGLAD